MTTDTAVRVTRMIVQEKSEAPIIHICFSTTDQFIVPLERIPYVDDPELHVNKNESTQMPFRYVKGANGEPIMPEVS